MTKKFLIFVETKVLGADTFLYRRVYFVLMQKGAHHGKIRSGSVQDPFRVRSGSVQTNFRPKLWEPKILNLKIFSICPAVAAPAGAL